MKSNRRVTGHTKVVGIFGDPVEHSRSPQMHNAAFAKLGLNYTYVPFHVTPAELARATRALRSLAIAGVNVTVPHKEKIRRHLDSESELAGVLGAVNTVIHRDGHLHGDNTDLVGFVDSLRALRVRLRGKRALVIGAGGASRAVLVGLGELGVRDIALANRTRARGLRLVRDLERHIPPTEVVSLDDLATEELLGDRALVVNATSLGWGRDRFPDLAASATPKNCLFYDMAYAVDTNFLRRARRAKRAVTDGSEMLIRQGARSFNLWTGRKAPLTAMRIAFNNKY